MWLALPAIHYPKLVPLIEPLRFNLILTVALEQTSPAKIFVDDAVQPRSAFLLTAEGYYLVGAAGHKAFNQHLKQYIFSDIFNDEDDVVLEFADLAWGEVLDDLFEKRVVKYPRYYYTFETFQLDWRSLLPPDFTMLPVDAAFLARPSLKNMEAVRAGITGNWLSVEHFLQHGFGMCLVTGETIVSWCLADCASASRCEIGIHTDPAYQRRGFAALTVAAAVELAQRKGYAEIGWHCWVHNLASWKVAERVGFVRQLEYMASIGLAHEARYLTELGLALARQENFQAALTWYEQAPDFGWAQVLAGEAWMMLGDVTSALRCLHAALDLGWDHRDYLQYNSRFAALHDQAEWRALLGRLNAS